MDVESLVRRRALRIPAVLMLVIAVAGVAIYQRWVHPDSTAFVPFLLLAYLAIELFLPFLQGKRKGGSRQ
jgi:hypothetical protein